MNSFNQADNVNTATRRIKWLASYPKSGNTWIRMFLNTYVTHAPININSAFQIIASDIDPNIFQMMMPRPLSEMTMVEQFMYHNGALLNIIKMAKTKDVIIKTHNAKATVEGIPLIPPRISTHSIYIIRDPRDICISAAAHFDITVSDMIPMLADSRRAGESEFGLSQMYMSWSDHVNSWTLQNKDVQVTVIQYEKLVTKTKRTFKLILEVLDINYDEERFNFALNETTFVNLQAKENQDGFNEQRGKQNFFRVGKLDQWKEILTKEQTDTINKQHKIMMQHYGYL